MYGNEMLKSLKNLQLLIYQLIIFLEKIDRQNIHLNSNSYLFFTECVKWGN